MVYTAVLVNASSNISTISKLNDQISNSLATRLGKWVFEYKLFRENPASQPAQPAPSSGGPSFLCTLSLSYHPGVLFSLNNGTGTVLDGDFDAMLTTKLQSLWTLRQVIRGEGYTYELTQGPFVLRLANMFLQGGFKGLLVEVEYNGEGSVEESIQKINEFLKPYDFEYKGTTLASTRIEGAWQYVEALLR